MTAPEVSLSASATQLQSTLTQLTEVQADELMRQFDSHSSLSAEQIRDFYLYAYPDLVQEMGAVAEQVTTDWYTSLDPDSYYKPVPAPVAPATSEVLTQDVRWAAGALFADNSAPDQFITRLVGAATRHLFNRSRETVTENTRREGVRWARQAHANACAFCRLSASRGPVYSSRLAVAGSAGSGGSAGYHNHCRCVAVPVRGSKPYTPPDYQLKWDEQYDQVAKELGTTDRDQVTNYWRQLIASGELA